MNLEIDPTIPALIVAVVIAVANFWYWRLTPTERADDERDFPSWL